MNFQRLGRNLSRGLLKLVLLTALVAASGAVLGLAIGYPVGRIQFSESNAIRLDQSRLAGTIDPAAGITQKSDLPIGWESGDMNLAAFGILGNEFCGEAVPLPKALSSTEASVFSNGSKSNLISQAVRVDGWQGAREYIRSVKRALDGCDKFYQPGQDGKRVRVDIKDGDGEAPITDFISRRYVSSLGSDVQSWSIMAVGDVLVGTRYLGQSSPQRSLLSDIENEILIRIAPQTFAVDGDGSELAPESTATPDASGPDSSVIEGGAADETPGLPGNETPTTAPGG